MGDHGDIVGELFGRTVCWLVAYEWRISRYGWETEPVRLSDLVNRYQAVFALAAGRARRLRDYLSEWRLSVGDESGPADLVGAFLRLSGGVKGRQDRFGRRTPTSARPAQKTRNRKAWPSQ